MPKKHKIIAILLAYNTAATLEAFYKKLPKELFDEIILVDDVSKDKTYKIAQNLGIESYQNKVNLGYGGNLKKALSLSLLHGADIIVDIHPDNEYKSDSIKDALERVKNGSELVLGNRFSDLRYILNESGMYIWKVIPIMILNLISKKILVTKVHDLHQGFRVYTKTLLEKINFGENSNDYLFSFELTAQAILYKANISEVPVKTNYTGKKRGASLFNSFNYSLGIFKILFLFTLAKIGYKSKIFKKPEGDLKYE